MFLGLFGMVGIFGILCLCPTLSSIICLPKSAKRSASDYAVLKNTSDYATR